MNDWQDFQYPPKYALLGDGCTSLVQIMQRREPTIILRGEAQRIFSMHVAEGLASQANGDEERCVRMFQFWSAPAALVGQRCRSFTEGDPDYMGCAGERVWFRYPGRN